MLLQRLKTVASEKPPPLPPSRDFETTTSLDYQWPQVDEHYNQTRGQRRMRTLDNAPTRGRDRTFLLEHQIASPHVCLEEEERGEDLAPLVEQDVPITIYSAKPQLFPMSNPSQGANPFGKDSGFTMPTQYFTRAITHDL
mmetsp:Transcript_3427/g.11840  ORF Transcript_3427/g.11840 Transcript_3427/m.11840 type:complete len:140 (+) Transcript_3427:384-803(+)